MWAQDVKLRDQPCVFILVAQVLKLRDQPCVFNLHILLQSDCLYVNTNADVCGSTEDRGVVKAPVWSRASNLTSYGGGKWLCCGYS